jgi:opacity protein-like surface antigen
MKKLLANLLLLAPISLFGGQYIGLHGGTAYPYQTDNKVHGQKVGYKVGALYGYDFSNNFRVEGELTYRSNDHKEKYNVGADDALISKEQRYGHSFSYMINGFYDIGQISFATVTPFVGIGIGLHQSTAKLKMRTDLDSHETKEKDSSFAYQGIVGIKYPISDKISLAMQYHYFCGQSHVKDHSFGVMVAHHF